MNTPIECSSFSQYKLIDSGNRYKLEQFGDYTLSRPEPQALWSPSLNDAQWKKMAHTHFERDKNNPEKGIWQKLKPMPDRWKMTHQHQGMQLQFRLGMTSFKHIGLFPEQAENWNYIYDMISHIKSKEITPKVLNLFAYTGGASLAAKAAGADVVHVDSVKQVVTWANENMQLSSLDGIRWVVEDAMKFVKREQKRGSKYNGIILDPPAYGRGPDGEKWVLEENIDELLSICRQIASENHFFIILNLYSMGYSPIIAGTLLETHFKHLKNIQYGEMYFTDEHKKKMPLGIYARGATNAILNPK